MPDLMRAGAIAASGLARRVDRKAGERLRPRAFGRLSGGMARQAERLG